MFSANGNVNGRPGGTTASHALNGDQLYDIAPANQQQLQQGQQSQQQQSTARRSNR